jgi:predicted alpha-1,2-mannosidase
MASRLAMVAAVTLLACAPAAPAAAQSDLTQYVNPLSGTLGSGFPMVSAAAPFGLIQLGPDTGLADGSQDPVNYCGYAYQDPTIRGFSLTHFDGAGIMIAGDLPFMPTTGAPGFDVEDNSQPYDHANETAQPGYYAVTLDRNGTRVELTSALRASMARVTFPQTAHANLVFDAGRSIDGANTGRIDVTGDRTISGWTKSPVGYTVWFTAAFDRPFASHTTRGPATAVSFDATDDRDVVVRMAISYIDADGAVRNLAADASPQLTFDRMRDRARAGWNGRLHQVEVSGGPRRLLRTFYSNLYRFYLMPSVFDDADGRYLGLDGQVRTVPAGSDHRYTALSLWDTYRTEFPLLTLLEPQVAHDVAISILDDADERGGNLPRWVQANIDRQIMGGDSATATLGDAVGEGTLTDDEGRRAYAAMLHNAITLPPTSARDGLAGYLERGWVGQDETGRSGAALTLEYAIDDAAMLPAARLYGTAEEVAALEKRGRNWQSLWSAADGFLRPRNKDGSWASPNPLGLHGVWRPEFQDGWQEGTGHQYLWFAPQDVGGLATTLGGADVAAQRLDDFFRAPAPVQDKGSFFGAYYVGTQFTPSNETDLWVPWYYDWLGRPWKAQREVRQAMSVHSARPDGMPGNDDTGTMAAWYVLAALGLYHAAPGGQAWQLSGPVFDHAVVRTGHGRRLVIDAPGSGRYIRSATLDGRPFAKTWLPSRVLHRGARLAFAMARLPDKTWATAPDAAPPSLSDSR